MKRLSPGWILFLVLDLALCIAIVVAVVLKKG
jgi:hypothetical protein